MVTPLQGTPKTGNTWQEVPRFRWVRFLLQSSAIDCGCALWAAHSSTSPYAGITRGIGAHLAASAMVLFARGDLVWCVRSLPCVMRQGGSRVQWSGNGRNDLKRDSTNTLIHNHAFKASGCSSRLIVSNACNVRVLGIRRTLQTRAAATGSCGALSIQ
jgi:hypothetical protein